MCVTSLSLWQPNYHHSPPATWLLSHIFLVLFHFLPDFLKTLQQAKEAPWLSCNLTFYHISTSFNCRWNFGVVIIISCIQTLHQFTYSYFWGTLCVQALPWPISAKMTNFPSCWWQKAGVWFPQVSESKVWIDLVGSYGTICPFSNVLDSVWFGFVLFGLAFCAQSNLMTMFVLAWFAENWSGLFYSYKPIPALPALSTGLTWRSLFFVCLAWMGWLETQSRKSNPTRDKYTNNRRQIYK